MPRAHLETQPEQAAQGTSAERSLIKSLGPGPHLFQYLSKAMVANALDYTAYYQGTVVQNTTSFLGTGIAHYFPIARTAAYDP